METEQVDEQTEESGNGQAPEGSMKGPGIDLSELKKVDGLIGKRVAQNVGVLVRAMTVHSIEEGVQELKLANFQSTDEADEYVSARNECRVLGMDPTPIYEQMVARSAGIKQSYINRIFDAITHLTYTTNYQKGDNRFVKNKNNSPFTT